MMTEMFKLKSCPRCKGDVMIDHDSNGWYEVCLNCGYERDLPPVHETVRAVKEEKRSPKRAS